MSQVCIFWTEYRVPEVRECKWSELRQGRLRQGWGGPGTQLVAHGRPVPFDTWLPGYTAWVRTWKGPEQRRREALAKPATRYDILTRMLSLEKGDLLVIPHMPSYWDARHFESPRWRDSPDFGHVVPVDPASLATWRLDSSVEARALAGRFQNYRSALNRVRQPDYAQTARRLFHREGIHLL